MSNERLESEQPEARTRVLAALQAAGEAGIESGDLCDRAKTHAAVRRVWELDKYYGYRILGEKYQRNQWRWTYLGKESWALDPSVSVQEAKTVCALRAAVLTSADHSAVEIGAKRKKNTHVPKAEPSQPSMWEKHA